MPPLGWIWDGISLGDVRVADWAPACYSHKASRREKWTPSIVAQAKAMGWAWIGLSGLTEVVLLWTKCLPPSKFIFCNLIPSVTVWGGGAFGRVIRSWGWSPHEWDWCPVRRGMRELASFFTALHQGRVRRLLSANQEVGSHQILDFPAYWVWTSQLAEWRGINIV